MQINSTIDAYDKYADIYDQEVVEFWDNFPSEFISKFVRLLPGKRVLNLGSGSGRDALLLREHGLDVICIDASSTMIDMTNRLGFESHQSTFDELTFPNEAFDGVWAYTSLIHVPKLEAEKVLGRVYAFLKFGGAFAIGAIEGETASMVERKTMPNSTRYFKMYKKDELQKLVEGCGLNFVHQQDYQPHNSVYLNQLYTKSS